jgi:two-component system, chemotaxis family, chemotaxis protein CheY
MKRILVVDDSPTIRRMVIATLRKLEDVEFDEANNGLEAIERLTFAPVSLVVLDLNMPDIHGLEVIEFVRSHNKYGATPICVLTTRGDEASREQVMAAGANLYLTKPFSPENLHEAASKLLAVS